MNFNKKTILFLLFSGASLTIPTAQIVAMQNQNVQQCIYPGCQKAAYPGHPFCGKTHAQMFQQLASQNQQVSNQTIQTQQCIYPGCTNQASTGYDCCSKAHGILVALFKTCTCYVPGCNKLRYFNGNLSPACSKNHYQKIDTTICEFPGCTKQKYGSFRCCGITHGKQLNLLETLIAQNQQAYTNFTPVISNQISYFSTTNSSNTNINQSQLQVQAQAQISQSSQIALFNQGMGINSNQAVLFYDATNHATNYILSNFYPCTIVLDINGTNYTFQNAEAAFQAGKDTNNSSMIIKFTQAQTGNAAFQLSKNIKPQSSWFSGNDVLGGYDGQRVDWMYKVLKAKFSQNQQLLQWLLATGTTSLIEDDSSHPGDWGWGLGTGKNLLGRLLMKIRSDLANDTTVYY